MADKTNVQKIEKLNNENFSTWSFRVKILLKKEDLWETLQDSFDEELPEEATPAQIEAFTTKRQTWKKNQNHAMEIIVGTIEPAQYIHVKNCNTGGEAWNILQEIHHHPTLGGRIRAIKKIGNIKLEAGGDMREHLDKLYQGFDELAEQDSPMQTITTLGITLGSVGKEYDNVVTAMEAWDEERLTMKAVRAKLVEEYDKKQAESRRMKAEVQTLREKIREEKQEVLTVYRESELNDNNEEYSEVFYGTGHSMSAGNNSLRAGNNHNISNVGNGGNGGNQAGKNNLRVGSSGSSNTEGAGRYNGQRPSGNSSRDGFLCHGCGIPGHFRANCPKVKKNVSFSGKNKESADHSGWYPTVFLHAIENSKISSWIVDSGASAHMCNDELLFTELDKKAQSKVVVGDGRIVMCLGKGKVKVLTSSKHENTEIIMNDVLFVPDLGENLVSVRRLAEKGYTVEFQGHSCILKRGNSKESIAIIDKGLYRMHKPKQEQCNTMEHSEEYCIHEWHTRLAHRHLDGIRKLTNLGLKIRKCHHSDVCEECLLGKMARKPFPHVATPTENNMDIIVSDVCGFMQTESLGKRKYFVTFIDLHSRYCEVYFIREKNEVADLAIQYITKMENQTGIRPKIFRSDRGTEYLTEKLKTFLKQKGIIQQCTVGYASEQNGVAERKNRTLMEAARAMIAEAGFPKSLWAEAVNTANYVINRIAVGKKNEMMSPYEKLFGKTPNLGKLQPFGKKAFVKIPDQKRRKLDNKSERMRFIGYDEMAKGYRMMNDKKKIIISREVKFLDEKETFTSRKEVAEKKQRMEKETLKQKKPEEKKSYDYQEYFSDRNDEILLDKPLEAIEEEEEDEEFHDAESSESDSNEENNPKGDEAAGPQLRRSTRTTKGKVPERLTYKAHEEQKDSEPKTFKQAMNSRNAMQWKCAMEEELEAINENKTWELSDLPMGRRAIGSRWVFKEKRDGNGRTVRYKARLVAQGFSQKYGVDYDEVFAPVARQTTMRLLLSIAGARKYHVMQYDIKSAFLNGKLEEEIYMKQPPGFQEGNKVYRLRKSLYGLKQSARVWNQTLHEALIQQGFTQNITDNCLYSWKFRGSVCYILIHVDDLLVAGNNINDINKLMEAVGNRFEITNLGGVKHYLGIDIKRDKEGRFAISQSSYIDSIIEEAGLTEAKTSKFPLDTGYTKQLGTPLEKNDEYRKLIGMLLYLTTNTRPDIAASVSILSRKIEHPRGNDMMEVKRVIKYLKGTRNLKLMLNDIGGTEVLEVYSDANWAEDTDDRKSNTGYFVGFNGGTISWCCRKQDLVAMSSAGSEYIALAETCKEVLWLQEILKGFDVRTEKTTTILTDSQSCIALLKNQRFSHRTKHFDTRFHFLKDHVTKENIRLEYVPTNENTADLMTKPLGGIKTEYLRGKAGLIEVETKSATSRRSVERNLYSNATQRFWANSFKAN